jgi:hypothetical protein
MHYVQPSHRPSLLKLLQSGNLIRIQLLANLQVHCRGCLLQCRMGSADCVDRREHAGFISLRIFSECFQLRLLFQECFIAFHDRRLVRIKDAVHLFLLRSAETDRLHHRLVIPPPTHWAKLLTGVACVALDPRARTRRRRTRETSRRPARRTWPSGTGASGRGTAARRPCLAEGPGSSACGKACT